MNGDPWSVLYLQKDPTSHCRFFMAGVLKRPLEHATDDDGVWVRQLQASPPSKLASNVFDAVFARIEPSTRPPGTLDSPLAFDVDAYRAAALNWDWEGTEHPAATPLIISAPGAGAPVSVGVASPRPSACVAKRPPGSATQKRTRPRTSRSEASDGHLPYVSQSARNRYSAQRTISALPDGTCAPGKLNGGTFPTASEAAAAVVHLTKRLRQLGYRLTARFSLPSVATFCSAEDLAALCNRVDRTVLAFHFRMHARTKLKGTRSFLSAHLRMCWWRHSCGHDNLCPYQAIHDATVALLLFSPRLAMMMTTLDTNWPVSRGLCTLCLLPLPHPPPLPLSYCSFV